LDILCPVCRFKGSISDSLIPEDGKQVSCPKCRAKIFIKKPVVSLTGGKPAPTGSAGSSSMELVSYDKAILDDVAQPEVTVVHAQCQNCRGDITVPDNKEVMLCPTCGATIVRQPIIDEIQPGTIGFAVRTIVQSFASVFNGWGRYLKRPGVNRAIIVILVLGAPFLLFFGLQKNRESREDIFDKGMDVTISFPTPEAGLSSESENSGILKNLIQIDISPAGKEEKEEVRIYQIVFRDGSTSDYFRYYRYNNGIVYITLPDKAGGSYELGYSDSDIQSIKRIRNLPANVKVYGVN